MVTLSVVIPATDRRATLDQVVAAVKRAAAGPEEVIVVDRPRHLGPAAARNLGSRRANGDVLVFLDADVEVHGDAFARIRAAFDNDASLTAVFGSYDDDPAGGGIVSDFRNLLHHHVHHEGAGVATTFWAGLGAVRRDAFLRVGGFDEERFPLPSIEDIELGMRLHRHGGRILLDPTIQGKHLKSWTFMGMAKTDLLRRGVPWLQLMLEDRSTSTALNLGWRQRVGTGASVLLLATLARRKFRLAGSILMLLIVLDRRFYGLLFRRRGGLLLAAGVPLHIVHRLTSAAAVPVALTKHLLSERRPPAHEAERGGGLRRDHE
ncbi:MAG: glycosyltransferase [Actinomycetota bacterium]|nr:glycosyltransferase [Actinomycetota bacterium]